MDERVLTPLKNCLDEILASQDENSFRALVADISEILENYLREFYLQRK